MPKLYLFDASVYIFRAYYALPDDMRDLEGRPVNAVYGFLELLTRLLRETDARHFAVAFDGSLRTSFRNRIYPAYKANRESPPEELLHQFELCRAFTAALGLAGFIHREYEADDLIGTAAHKMRRHGYKMVFITEDKDLAQLMRPGDLFWRLARRETFDYDGVARKYLVAPERMAELLALCGDSVDNIPGIKGLGPKTAAALLGEFGSLANLLRKLEQLRDRREHRTQLAYRALKTGRAQVRMAHRLTRIAHTAPLGSDAGALRRRRPDAEALRELGQECDFSPTFIRRLLEV